MKEYTQHIENIEKHKLHPKLDTLFNDISFNDLPHTIFYGPKGIGKYANLLNIIRKYSKNNLNYYKKAIVLCDKTEYYIRLSDIHYEVDMSLLGCNSKTLWNTIYNHIIDIVLSSPTKKGIIVCKNFEYITSDLMEVFYCYVNDIQKNIDLKFFFITTNISSIYPSLLNQLEIVSLKRPSKSSYLKLGNKTLKQKINNINNIDNTDIFIKNIDYDVIPTNKKNTIINTLYDTIVNSNKQLDLFYLRERLYDLLLFQLDIYDVFFYIIRKLYEENKISKNKLSGISIECIRFSKLYNNNYRPIFHLERMALYLIETINQ